MPIKPNAFYFMDRGYLDFARLHRFSTIGAFFFGRSPNAVKTQIWVAISIYFLVAIVRKELKIARSQTDILQILSLTLFEKMPLFQALSDENLPIDDTTSPNQPSLFDL